MCASILLRIIYLNENSMVFYGEVVAFLVIVGKHIAHIARAKQVCNESVYKIEFVFTWTSGCGV